MTQSAVVNIIQRPGIRQFAKFCIIGFSSLLIDVTISYQLIYSLHFNPTLAKALSFLVAVTNGFFWNSRWTFRGMGAGRRHEVYLKFILVNTVGLILNLVLFKTVLFLFTGRFLGQGMPTKPQFAIATGVAVVCVSAWNFIANKKWTFAGSTESTEAL